MGRCLIVGVLNCTPDSFSDGGHLSSPQEAIEAGVRMAGEGADWIDIGGESTRPGAQTVSGEEERARVIPVIEGLRARLRGDVLISIDTYKADTARAASTPPSSRSRRRRGRRSCSATCAGGPRR
jgi:dihydropteroate synthase